MFKKTVLLVTILCSLGYTGIPVYPEGVISTLKDSILFVWQDSLNREIDTLLIDTTLYTLINQSHHMYIKIDSAGQLRPALPTSLFISGKKYYWTVRACIPSIYFVANDSFTILRTPYLLSPINNEQMLSTITPISFSWQNISRDFSFQIDSIDSGISIAIYSFSILDSTGKNVVDSIIKDTVTTHKNAFTLAVVVPALTLIPNKTYSWKVCLNVGFTRDSTIYTFNTNQSRFAYVNSLGLSNFKFVINLDTTIKPRSDGFGIDSNYSVSPALPKGLVLNISSGKISGTPTVITNSIPYTITTHNTLYGTETTNVYIQIVDKTTEVWEPINKKNLIQHTNFQINYSINGQVSHKKQQANRMYILLNENKIVKKINIREPLKILKKG